MTVKRLIPFIPKWVGVEKLIRFAIDRGAKKSDFKRLLGYLRSGNIRCEGHFLYYKFLNRQPTPEGGQKVTLRKMQERHDELTRDWWLHGMGNVSGRQQPVEDAFDEMVCKFFAAPTKNKLDSQEELGSDQRDQLHQLNSYYEIGVVSAPTIFFTLNNNKPDFLTPRDYDGLSVCDVQLNNRDLSDWLSTLSENTRSSPKNDAQKIINRRGRSAGYAWGQFEEELMKLFAKYGPIGAGTPGWTNKAHVVEMMKDWCDENWEKTPGDTELKRHVSKVLDEYLKEFEQRGA